MENAKTLKKVVPLFGWINVTSASALGQSFFNCQIILLTVTVDRDIYKMDNNLTLP